MDFVGVRFGGPDDPGHYVFHTYRGGVYCYCLRNAQSPLVPRRHHVSFPYLAGRSECGPPTA